MSGGSTRSRGEKGRIGENSEGEGAGRLAGLHGPQRLRQVERSEMSTQAWARWEPSGQPENLILKDREGGHEADDRLPSSRLRI